MQLDNQPDVHEVARLPMRSFRIYGLPVRLQEVLQYTHSSWKQAN